MIKRTTLIERTLASGTIEAALRVGGAIQVPHLAHAVKSEPGLGGVIQAIKGAAHLGTAVLYAAILMVLLVVTLALTS